MWVIGGLVAQAMLEKAGTPAVAEASGAGALEVPALETADVL
jgi:hypothetical protein